MKIIKITAMWCPSCLIMNNVYEKIAKEFNLTLESLDYDFDEDKVKELNVGNVLPVLIVYRDGVELTRIIGEKKYDEVSAIIKELSNEKD